MPLNYSYTPSRSRPRSIPTSASEKRILAVIASHRTVPTGESIAAKVPGMTERKIGDAKRANPRIKAAWHAKVLELVKKMTPAELFSNRISAVCATVPEAVEHKKKVMLHRIATYTGRPSLSQLVQHVTGSQGSIESLRRHKEVERAAVAKLLSLLRKMSNAKITRQRLDRNTAGEVKQYLDKRFNRGVADRR